ncbi:MAG: beta-glucuronidase [Chitinivibrionales bacterium]|nr:beta-glucuronidase [Chitinivibrionales bacterium]
MLYPQQNAHRYTSSLDGLWSFRVQRTEDDASTWPRGFTTERLAAVPASFNELFLDYDTTNLLGVVWYARSLQVPDALRDKRLVVRFGAINYAATVYLNGEQIGAHETGYTPFEVSLNGHLRDDDNLLVVRVDTNLTPDTVPQGNLHTKATAGQFTGNTPRVNFDFFPYGGIHRPVVLCATEPDCLDTLWIDTDTDGTTGLVTVRGECLGAVDRATVRIVETGASADADIAGNAFETRLSIPDVKLWGCLQPNLYHVEVALVRDGIRTDVYRRHFGVRTVRIEGDRVLLNGEPVTLRGFGKHEDFFVSGKGLNEAVNVRDMELLKWIGANSFRTSHYPYAEEMLTLADKVGILVISESPAVSIVTDLATERTLETHCRVLREYMARDYNHPCVVMWSVANECTTHVPSSRPYFEKVVATAREMDAKRPITMAMCHWPDERCWDLLDVIGVNAYPGWYGGGAPLDQTQAYFRGFLDSVYEKVRKPIMITEIGGDAIAGFHSLPPVLWTEDYQRDLLRANLEVIDEKAYIVGAHVWAFADFHTAQNDRRAYGNRKGVFTRDRTPKMAAYELRRMWRGDSRG